ncbi:MAG: phage portal protein, partial [Hyphomicrobiaceae bacterium]
FDPDQARDEFGRWTTGDTSTGSDGDLEGILEDATVGIFEASESGSTPDDGSTSTDDAELQEVSRRRAGPTGTPAQEVRLDAAAAQARDATRRVRELDPEWRGPQSVTAGMEGAIAHQEATARAAEARLNEVLRDAVPGTNPAWGVNRLTKDLYDRGYILERPARGAGMIYTNPGTGEEVRIMEYPIRRYRTDPDEKFYYDYYYRYRTGNDQGWGRATPVPNKKKY